MRNDQVPKEIMEKRLQRIQEQLSAQQLRFNQSKIGTVQPVLIDRPGKRPGQMIGKTPFMQSVVLENAVHYDQQLVDVRITHAYGLSLKGEVMGRSGIAA